MKIVSAAVVYGNIIYVGGEIPHAYTGQMVKERHHDILHRIHALSGESSPSTQGFMTDTGHFVTRDQAWHVAEKAGQILQSSRPGPRGLYTEDLW